MSQRHTGGGKRENGKGESIAVGFPNPSGRGNQAPAMDDAPKIALHLAPEGRHVYRTATYTKYPKAPEGRHVAASYGRRQNGKMTETKGNP